MLLTSGHKFKMCVAFLSEINEISNYHIKNAVLWVEKPIMTGKITQKVNLKIQKLTFFQPNTNIINERPLTLLLWPILNRQMSVTELNAYKREEIQFKVCHSFRSHLLATFFESSRKKIKRNFMRELLSTNTFERGKTNFRFFFLIKGTRKHVKKLSNFRVIDLGRGKKK